jgi:hypothetical protein
VAFVLLAAALVTGPEHGSAQSTIRFGALEESTPAPSHVLSIADAAVAEGDSGTRALTFMVQLSAASPDTVRVDVTSADSTATVADLDYEAVAASLTFAPGSVAESLMVVVTGDTRIEGDEVFAMRLSDATGAVLADSIAVGTIMNDDVPLLSLDDAYVMEGDTGTRELRFRLHLDAAHWQPVTVDLVTADSTATVVGGDYVAVAVQLTLPPGTVADSVAVPVYGDLSVEGHETLLVRLIGLSGAAFADSEAVGTILDDDLPVLSVADTSVDEGDSGSRTLAFRVRLTPPVSTPVSFHYKTSDGTARIANGDYLAADADTMFLPGEEQIVLAIPVQGDSLLEANERFTLLISAVQGASPAELSAIGTIRNDERTSFARLVPAIPMLAPGTFPPAWGDVDNDGRADLPLYHNTGGGFMEMAGVRAALGDGNYHGSAWCDYDRDGDMDVVVMPYDMTSSSYNFTHLLENTAEGLLQEVASAKGMDIEGHGETPSWADFNADGWPDLFLPFYSHVAPWRNYFYLNLGNGEFLECADSAGVSMPDVPSHLRVEGVGVADWNGDGTLDIYVGSHLFLNDGDAHFSDVRAQVGLPVVFDEGCQFVDHDDDGDLDLYMRIASGPALYRNDGGMFTNVSASLGVGNVGWEFGDRWADLDADGDLDLLFFPPGAKGRLLLSLGDGTFREDTTFMGTLVNSGLAAFADLDGDGDTDIAAGANGRQFALNLLEHVPRANAAYLKVRVEDDEGRLVAHGSTVRLRSLDDPRHPIQTRIVDGGSGYLGQDEYTITFGGVGSGAFDLEVSYPSKPGSPRKVGPAQNPLLGGLRPGVSGPQLVIVRPSGLVTIQSITTSAGVSPALHPPLARLGPAAPNPARRATSFAFSVPGGGGYSLTIHDLSGRLIRVLARRGSEVADANVAWDLRDDAGQAVPPGLYFARLQHGRERAGVQRVVVLR